MNAARTDTVRRQWQSRTASLRRMSLAGITVMLGLLAPLACAEILLRMVDWPRPVVIGWKPSAAAAETNQFGFRGHRFSSAADVRVVLLGDSHVEAAANRFEQLPEMHLQRVLESGTRRSVSVVSIGAGGWGQDQQLLALTDHVGEIRPQLVVLWFTWRNDLWNNTFPTHMPRNGRPKPTFWFVGGELRGPSAAWLALYRRAEPYLFQAVRRAAGKPLYPTDDEWERYLPPAYQPRAIDVATPSLTSTIAKGRGVTVGELAFSRENFDTEKTHYSVYLVPASERLLYSVKLTRALLQKIHQLSEAHNARFVILTPEDSTAVVSEEPTLFEFNGKGYLLSARSARRLLDDVLQGMPTIRVPAPPAGSFVSATDHHFNERGSRHVMEALAERLLPELHSTP